MGLDENSVRIMVKSLRSETKNMLRDHLMRCEVYNFSRKDGCLGIGNFVSKHLFLSAK